MDKTVLLVTPDNSKIPSFGYRCKKAFQKLGWRTHTFNYRFMQMHRTSLGRSLVNRLLLNRALHLNPDLVFVDKGESLLPGIIEKISDNGIKTSNWCLDDPFGEFSSFNNIRNRNEYDSFNVFDPYYVRKLKETGQPNAYYLPCAVDPELHKEVVPFKEREYIADVSFIGSHDAKRQKVLESISDFDLKIWGYRWDSISRQSKAYPKVQKRVFKFDRSVTDLRESCRMFNLTKVNLNIHSPHSREGVNLRCFEIPATKSFQLCDYYKEIPKLFKLNKEIVCYRDVEELKELSDYYLTCEDERNVIAEAGKKRILDEHTFITRIRKMLLVFRR